MNLVPLGYIRRRQFSEWLPAPVLHVILVLVLGGCGPSPGQPVVEHSSPEGLFASFCQALTERDGQRLVDVCDPPLRPTWRELLNWAEKQRVADTRPPAEFDFLQDMQSRFCGNEKLLFERAQPDLVHVRNVPQGRQMTLRKRNGKWYIGFYDNPEQAEYSLKLATEIIKSQLGEPPASHRDAKMGHVGYEGATIRRKME